MLSELIAVLSVVAGGPALATAGGVRPEVRPNEGTYTLWRGPDRTHVFRHPEFEARVAPDGHVVFEDAHPPAIGPFGKTYRRAGDERPSLAGALQDVARADRRQRSVVDAPVCAHNPDPRLPPSAKCRRSALPISVSGSFDLTDEMLDRVGPGWNRLEKAKFLSATFEFRMKLAAQHRQPLPPDPIELSARLDDVWRDERYTLRERRRMICLVWAGLSSSDPEARQTSDILLGWIAHQAPRAGPTAFSSEEIAACAADGDRPFRPYP